MRQAKDAIISQHYKLPISVEEMNGVLCACYEFEVKFRGKEPVMDEHTLAVLGKVARWMVDEKTKSSLLLFGGVGNGKTTVAKSIRRAVSALATTAKNNAIIENNVERRDPLALYSTPAFYSAQSIVDETLSDEERYNKLIKSDLIIIDDLGCEPVSAKVFGTELTPTLEILRSRYDSMRSTVITTNLDLESIRTRYGGRILDRMIETYEFIAFESKSYRN